MSDRLSNAGQFDLVVEVNEGAKQMRALSGEVGMRALDAVIRSRKSGAELAGFGEVSAQMRTWAESLQQEVETLNASSGDAVGRVSMQVKRARQLALMEAAATSPVARALVAAVIATARRDLAVDDQKLADLWRALGRNVGDLAQMGVMACALSRSAMIEAESGSVADRDVLLEVAAEFSRRSEEVVAINKGLRKKLLRRGQ